MPNEPQAYKFKDIVVEARELITKIEPERKTALCKSLTHTASLFMAQQMIRRLADEVEAQRNAVDKLITDQYLQMTPEQKALYDDIWNRSIDALDEEEADHE